MSDFNLHTCAKAAAGWQQEGACQQCEKEKQQADFFKQFPPENYYERERLKQSETCEHTYQEDSTVCTKCGT